MQHVISKQGVDFIVFDFGDNFIKLPLHGYSGKQAPKAGHRLPILAFEYLPLLQRLGLVEGFNPITASRFHTFFDLNDITVLMQRARLEADDKFKQLLPYLPIRKRNDKGEWVYLTYQRILGGGESKLLGNYSIAPGGHIDHCDVEADDDNGILLATTIANNVQRELNEEVALTLMGVELEDADWSSIDHTFIGFIDDNSNKVGQYHLASVFVFSLPEGYDAKTKENSNVNIGWLTLNELKAVEKQLESWSSILLPVLEKLE